MTARDIGRHSNIVVGALMGLALMYVAFALAGWRWGLALTLLLIYEAWTLVNAHPEDTLSESVWRLSVRPMVPWLFGVATGWALESGFLVNAWLVLALGFLEGHFFFQAHREQEKRLERTVGTYCYDLGAPMRVTFDFDARGAFKAGEQGP